MTASPDPRITRVDSLTFEARWGDTTARCSLQNGDVPLAHLGCRRVRNTIKPLAALPPSVREQCDEKYGPEWRKQRSAIESVVEAVAQGIDAADLRGAILVDTMRRGSDYWRPGNLLSKVAMALRSLGLEIAYGREDSICPAHAILDRYRHDESMTFAEYAAEYEAQLSAEKGLALRTAAFLAGSAISRGLLPVYYCIDPYLPGYGANAPASRPFAERMYPSDPSGYLREHGCHRVVLTECLQRFFETLGFRASIVELDVNAGAAYLRRDPSEVGE